MKKDIHPEYKEVVFLDTSSEFKFMTKSTMTSKETKVIDGVEHYVIHCEVTSATHPFWTGKMHRLDTAGRIDRFNKKFDKIATGKRKTRKQTVRKSESEE